MTYTNFISRFLCFAVCIYSSGAFAMNMLRPYKFFYNTKWHHGTRWQVFVRPEHGFRASGFNSASCRTDVTRIWRNDCDALAMLDGFDSSSPIGRKRVEVDASDDGQRGHLCTSADFDVDFGCTLAVRRALPHNIMLGLYMPFFTARVSHVQFCDQTLLLNAQDERVHEYLTDDFAHNVCQLGGLDIGAYRRTGPGDLALVADWLQDFPQPRPLLKNVMVGARLGFTLPTGRKEDVHKILALPFGYNGTATLLFGGGLTLSYISYFKAGFDVELRKPVGRSFVQRIKTTVYQTELVLLQKACGYIDYAFDQQYTLFGQLQNIVCGLSFKIAYQFFKHGDDQLSLDGNAFSSRIAGSSERLAERNWHLFLMSLNVDVASLLKRCMRVLPTVSVYAEIPFKGKRAIVCPIIGGILNIDF